MGSWKGKVKEEGEMAKGEGYERGKGWGMQEMYVKELPRARRKGNRE